MNETYVVEGEKPFAESLIWKLNQDYYHRIGVDAWRKGVVPHYLTSSSMVGKTYAELIFGFLRDLAAKGQTKEKVYILELGAGHGRLAFHTLKHLDHLLEQTKHQLPDFCYVLSDIAQDNLQFFLNHSQFQPYFDKGCLDVAYFDAVSSQEISLRYAKKTIRKNDLNQPLMVLANYFFDSIPTDLFRIANKEISACSVSLNSKVNPDKMDESQWLNHLETSYHQKLVSFPHYKKPIFDEILEDYLNTLTNTYIFFPSSSIQCINNLEQLSKKGVCVITMDKGSHEIHDLEGAVQPELITHGSFSFNVNFHALAAYCDKRSGKALFPSFSSFHIQLGCMLFLENPKDYTETHLAYRRFVNDFGPDDYNGLKKFALNHINDLGLMEIIAMLRLSAYDSTMFVRMLPRIKEVAKSITFNGRERLAQTLHETWNMYFTLYEPEDIAFEMGGIFYLLGFYREAVKYFGYSVSLFGHTTDAFFNKAICYYQLREDTLFQEIIKEAKNTFPDFEGFKQLDALDLGAR